uniref:Uncharacterized protein n=1 Tax=Lactuca sativa TaxID=4236 RepID=A0A9R1X2P4_LACSA|nr:hypothetical protein LSAT_V11C700361400 [Lactuca sativa]
MGKIRACTAKYISMEILDVAEFNPTVPIRSIQDQLHKRLQVGLSIQKSANGKRNNYKEDYLLELQATNVDTTIKLEVVNEPNSARETKQFKRVYVCLGALKKGFKARLRYIIRLDGAFMKGPFLGQGLLIDIVQFDKDTFEWLKRTPLTIGSEANFQVTFCTLGFSLLVLNVFDLFDMVFNSKLIPGSDKPIICCLEFIRKYLVKRIYNVMKVMSKAPGPLTPTTSKLLIKRNREVSAQYRARWNLTTKYEVYGP